ncbi:MAG: type II 3-dehydroquinate dehydratase [Promicromonosporaceae bacterium]|nr:type II 3-dehydroquinate dehydratase [Promicromonosporaceae bacterium]
MTRVLIINGPNLGRLGVREPEIYGADTHDDLVAVVGEWGSALGLDVEVRQSDDEATLVGWLHEAADARTHVVLNPAAFTHYSYALRDAAAQVTSAGLTLIEVHLSNPHARESFRHHSTISGVATGTIAGLGFTSYHLALEAIRVSRLED